MTPRLARPNTRTVTIRVVAGEQEQPVAHANVWIYDPVRSAVIGHATTDVEGRASIRSHDHPGLASLLILDAEGRALTGTPSLIVELHGRSAHVGVSVRRPDRAPGRPAVRGGS